MAPYKSSPGEKEGVFLWAMRPRMSIRRNPKHPRERLGVLSKGNGERPDLGQCRDIDKKDSTPLERFWVISSQEFPLRVREY